MANTSLKEEFKVFLQIIFVCNPLTMFFFNLFAPQKAARFAFQPKFGQTMRDCYTFFASLMPFYWNKFWIELAGVGDYDDKLQERFCWEFSRKPETLKQMSDGALRLLWRRRGVTPLSDKKTRLEHAMLFIEAGKMNDCRFEDVLDFVEDYIVWAYIKRGALPKQHLRMLTLKAACNSSTADYRGFSVQHELNGRFLQILVAYTKKYGLTSECLQIVHHVGITKPEADKLQGVIDESMNIFSQRSYTVSQKSESDLTGWRAFCKSSKKIYTEAQMQMNVAQYLIFNETGHTLDVDAILFFVRKVNKPMCQEIFRHEPDHGVAAQEVSSLINATPELRNMFYQTLGEKEK